ncbi:MAG: hypothetical protein JSW11_09365 [Candidatus Heimdallarchaeota archaeon]|nr:MAG: hypothetical protein JSW11_09365 [Candidatus Heimdallarchaeota archaeon]
MSIIVIVGFLALISSLLLFLSTILTFPLFRKARDEIFLHMNLVLFLFATTLLITGLFAIFLPEMSEAIEYLSLMKLHYLLRIVILFMLLTTVEFSFIYTNLSSNRLFFLEKYIPLVPALFIGWICASAVTETDFLDTLSFFGLYLLTFLVDLMIIVLLIRLRNVREKFIDRKPERALLTHVITMLVAFLFYQSGDLIGFIGFMISQDLYILALLSQFILMPVFSFLLLLQSRSIWKILDEINYSLLLNEIN